MSHRALLAVAALATVSAATVAALCCLPARASGVLEGIVVQVVDGDTIAVDLVSGPVRVRFYGIDAPEHDQPWGVRSREALAGRLQGRRVRLEVLDQDTYGRAVARVFLGTDNLNDWQVQEGNAWAFRRYLHDETYCAWEGIARTQRRGLWSQPASTWVPPWDWRAVQQGRAASAAPAIDVSVSGCVLEVREAEARSAHAGSAARSAAAGPSSGCLIKGNVSDRGRIYHLPGSDAYDKVRIDPGKGERWFCTEDEARAAGWRPVAH
ncbi:MAG: thermonuclease family protein [Steroidobacteraceae bacterium]